MRSSAEKAIRREFGWRSSAQVIEDTSALRDVARRLLAHEGGDDGDPVRKADAAEGICHKLRQQFGPVIGEVAFRAWALRAMKLTRARYPFLTVDLALEQGARLKGLRGSVEGRDPAEAGEALTALVVNFLAVFIGLMGKDLPLTFLREAWPEVEID